MPERVPLEQIPGVDQNDYVFVDPAATVAELVARADAVIAAFADPEVRDVADEVIWTLRQVHNHVRKEVAERTRIHDDSEPEFDRLEMTHPRENGKRPDQLEIMDNVLAQMRATFPQGWDLTDEQLAHLTPAQTATRALVAPGASTYGEVAERIEGPLAELLDLYTEME